MITAFSATFDTIRNDIVTPFSVSSPDGQERYENCRALWDTGAVISCISLSLAEKLGLEKQDDTKIVGANNEPFSAPVFCVRLKAGGLVIPYHSVVGLPMDGNEHEMIIGMDVISKGDLSITNYIGRTMISFRTPSLEPIDYVRELNLQKKCNSVHNANIKAGRPDKCACGSGRDYKNCHGLSPYTGRK